MVGPPAHYGAMWSAFASLRSFAEAENIYPSYIARVLLLTLHAPNIVEAVLDGRQPVGPQLDDLLTPLRVERFIRSNTRKSRGGD